MPAAICLGIIGGLMGAFFINVNTRMAVVRKKLLTAKWMKPIETFLFCFATASCFYWIPFFFNNCSSIDE
jgi:H+/Cl- antiporter ClcA